MVLGIVGFFASPAWADGSGTGEILPNWHIYGDGNLFFFLTGVHDNSACSYTDRWAINTTTTVGRSQYAAFLYAVANGKKVAVSGNSQCIHGNTEAVFDFQVL